MLGWITAEDEGVDGFGPSERSSPPSPPPTDFTLTAGALMLTDLPPQASPAVLPTPQARGVRLPPIHNRMPPSFVQFPASSVKFSGYVTGNSSAVAVPWSLDSSGHAFPVPVSQSYRTPRLRLDRSTSPGQVNTAFEGDVFEDPEPSLFTPSRLKSN